ncbi:MAG: hypothetical protein U0610_29060 [bacterium]
MKANAISPRNWTRLVVVGSMALAGLLALVAPSGAGNGPGGGPRAEGRPGPDGGYGPGPRMMLGGGPLMTSLGDALHQAKLTEAQQATLDGVRKQAETLRDDARKQFESVHADIEAELAKAEPDLRALSQRMTALHEQMRKSFDGVRDGYLALYDQLSTDQKKSVAATLRARLEEMKKRHESWHHGPHGGWDDKDANG